MNNLKVLSVLALVLLSASSALAFDLVTTCSVEVVEGITIAETTKMNFGQVADHDGTLVLSTNPSSPMTDAAHISFDDTGYTPGIFTCTSIPGASITATLTDADDVAGLNLGTFTVSLDAGGSNEGNLATITQIAAADTWHIGATLTVVAADAELGAQNPGYTVGVVLN